MSRKHKFGNSKATNYLVSLPVIELETSGIINRCKFNFSYLDLHQPLENPATELSADFMSGLIQKLKNYSSHPLSYWLHQRVGGGGRSILEIYKKFPRPSDFTHPPAVPNDVEWARFRMEGAVRLAGFVVPSTLSNKLSDDGKFAFCGNTFYVVFVDLEHRFYKS